MPIEPFDKLVAVLRSLFRGLLVEGDPVLDSAFELQVNICGKEVNFSDLIKSSIGFTCGDSSLVVNGEVHSMK